MIEALQNSIHLILFGCLWGAFLLILFFYSTTTEKRDKFFQCIKIIFFVLIGVRVLYSLGATLLQYHIWQGNPFTQPFLLRGIDALGPIGGLVSLLPFLGGKFGYFTFYCFIHFWLATILSLVCAFFFVWFLKTLQKYRERFFEPGEVELGGALILLVGWPGVIPFIFLSFLSVILVSIVRGVIYKESFTTLGIPFLLATALVLLFGNVILTVTGLSVLRVTNLSL